MSEPPACDHPEENPEDVLKDVVVHSAREPVFMAQLERLNLFTPRPADLDWEAIQPKLDQLAENLGGPPRLLITLVGDPPPEFDFYVEAAIREAGDAFARARTSVCRAHMSYLAISTLAERPNDFRIADDGEIRSAIEAEIRERFWEHTETAFIRLASHWDRVGQLLDFAFFNIRQYERDGFAAVMDRIRSNILPVTAVLANHQAWQRLRQYQTSEQPDGLKWLIRRRNFVVHSLHLSPPPPDRNEDPIFAVAYNHLDVAIKKRLKPGSPKEELDLLHVQLQKAAGLFESAIDVALAAPVGLRRDFG